MEEWGKTGERKNNEGNKFSGEIKTGEKRTYKKYEVINIMVRYSPVGKDRGSFPGVSPIFFSQCIWQTSKSIPGQVNLLSQIGGLNYWFIHPYKKLSQIGGLISWVIRPYKFRQVKSEV